MKYTVAKIDLFALFTNILEVNTFCCTQEIIAILSTLYKHRTMIAVTQEFTERLLKIFKT